MKNNLSDLFNLTELKKFIFKRDNLKVEFCRMILEGNYQEASKTALKIFDTAPSYLVLAYFLQLKKDRENKSIQRLLEILLEKQEIGPDVALLLAKENILVEVAVGFLEKCTVRDYVFQIIKKELIIKGHIPFEEEVLDEIDDWDLYQFVIEKRIKIKKRDTINYKYYVLHTLSKEDEEFKEACDDLLRRIRVYKDLKYLMKLCGVKTHEDYLTNTLINFLDSGFSLQKAKEIYLNLQTNKFNILTGENEQSNNCTSKEYLVDKFNLLKCLLGHLIASKDIHLLVLALYLTYTHRKAFSSNYEISLIHLFLCRFFSFYTPVSSMFFEFDVKNNQFYTMAFIWSDMLILSDIQDEDRVREYQSLLSENMKIIENSLKHFIEKNKFLHTISLLKVYGNLKEEMVGKELKARKILSQSSETLFSDLLGRDCAYLFKKITKEDVGGKYLYSLYFSEELFSPQRVDDLFKNPLGDITDEEFKGWFKEFLPCQ